MEWWQSVILGLVEGITEYLPVSSTGHLILVSSLLGLDTPALKPAVDDFNIIAQGGAVLAVGLIYRVRVGQLLAGLGGRDRVGRQLLANLVLAFMPAAVMGVVVGDAVQARLFAPAPVLGALAVGGLIMIGVERLPPRAPRSIECLSAQHALLIGLAQCLALWPGTSRSMTTIVAGLLVGLSAAEAAQFSFLLGLPTLGAACGYKLAKNLTHAAATGEAHLFETLGVAATLLGITVATLSAVLAVRWLVGFLQRHGLAVFGWYRVGLAAALAALGAAGVIDWQAF